MHNSSQQRRNSAAAPSDIGAPLKGQPAPTPREAYLKQVPPTPELRAQIEAAVSRWVNDSQAASGTLARRDLEFHGHRLLAELHLPEGYLGWTMVALASAAWQRQVEPVPYDRRLLLLPRCLRDESRCPAEFDELGLLCQDCGACELSGLRAEAHEHGYRVLIAEGTPAVVRLILSGQVNAILGVGCLDALEKTLDKLLSVGIPAMAVPLLRDGCHATAVDLDAVRRLIHTPHTPPDAGSATLDPRGGMYRRHSAPMRLASQLFEPPVFDRLCPPRRSAAASAPSPEEADPIAFTESVAREYLAGGGKRLRPLLTMATYEALSRDQNRPGPDESPDAATANGPDDEIPDAVQAIALATEAFHKASLVHDDVEDDDPFRYGRPTLHRQFDVATAINVGDYLIGLGYRLIAAQSNSLPADAVADLLAIFSSAHTRLCEGQGAELRWRSAPPEQRAAIEPLEVLKIYALKTAPAFEAALLAGMRLASAGSLDNRHQTSPQNPIAAAGRPRSRGAAAGTTGGAGGAAGGAAGGGSEQPVPRGGARGLGGRSVSDDQHPSPADAAARFARHLGVAYQVLNDLDDWRADPDNKRRRGADLLAARPTVLWALANRHLDARGRKRLAELAGRQADAGAVLGEATQLYTRAGVFEQAESLLEKHHRRAIDAIDAIPSKPLQRLLELLAAAILDRPVST